MGLFDGLLTGSLGTTETADDEPKLSREDLVSMVDALTGIYDADVKVWVESTPDAEDLASKLLATAMELYARVRRVKSGHTMRNIRGIVLSLARDALHRIDGKIAEIQIQEESEGGAWSRNVRVKTSGIVLKKRKKR